MAITLELLKIKVMASSATHKLQAIEQIKDGWDTEDDNDFALARMEIGLYIEYAINVFEEIATMTEQLLSSPPAYNDNPDEALQRKLEILVLCASAHDYVGDLEAKLAQLKTQVNDAMGARVEEAFSRAKTIHVESHDITTVARKLRQEEITQ